VQQTESSPRTDGRQAALADNDPLVGRLLDERYRIISPIARGGMSMVYEAMDERLERRIALKVMSPALSADPAFADRFSREARAAARLAHPNVVAVYDQGTDGTHVFLAMQLVRGRTLRDLIRSSGPLSPAAALSIMEPVLEALGAAHKAGLVHRDVKPENILLADDGTVKVADFGLARAVDTDASSTRTGLMMGTVAYCAPEQIAHGQCDQRSDVYAAGVVLFELLTGSVPYVGDSAMAVAYQHVHSRVPAASSRINGIAEALDDLLIRATDSDASFRPVNASQMLNELREIRRDLRLPTIPLAALVPSTTQLADASSETAPMPGGLSVHDTTVVPAKPGSGNKSKSKGVPMPAPVAQPDGAGLTRQQAKAGNRRPRWKRLALVFAVVFALTSGLGYGAWWFTAGRYAAVPNVVGSPLDTAAAALRQAGFKQINTKQAFNETVAKNDVISTSPDAGTHLLPSKPVTLTVSLGKERFTVPDVHSNNEADAKASLAKVLTREGMQAFTVTSTTQANDTVPKGQVISTTPAAGTLVKRNTAITLAISSGPPVLVVPDVSGKPKTDATAALKSAGFKVASNDVNSDTVPAGTVISQDPAGGSQLVKFSTITLTTSLGPQFITLPSVANMSVDQAKQALTTAGFVVTTKWVFYTRYGLVASIDVDKKDKNDAGQVRRGATVTLNLI